MALSLLNYFLWKIPVGSVTTKTSKQHAFRLW
jgi:hypothetical protein